MDGTLTVKKLEDNIWTFNEAVEVTGPQVDAYLITGTKRALVVDTLLEERSLYAKVRELTSLPIDVLISHGHRDHAGISTRDFYEAGCDVYVNEKDLPWLAHDLDPARMKPLLEGMKFDIGGYCLETIMVPGHTPGSAVFLERNCKHLYTGDAIGAGVFWMQVPTALPLRELQKQLNRLWNTVKDIENLLILPGHRHQAPVPLGLEFLADTMLATDKIINGEWTGEPREMDHRTSGVIKYRSVAYKLIKDYAYRPDNI